MTAVIVLEAACGWDIRRRVVDRATGTLRRTIEGPLYGSVPSRSTAS